MFSFIWPIALVIFSNMLYHICAKSVSQEIHPLASLTATYLTGAAASAVLYYMLSPHPNLIKEYGRLNWAPFALGIAIVLYHEARTWNKLLGVAICLVGLVFINLK